MGEERSAEGDRGLLLPTHKLLLTQSQLGKRALGAARTSFQSPWKGCGCGCGCV